MAEFCNQCAKALFDEPIGDFANMLRDDQYEDGYGAAVLCEECGATVTDKEGNCKAQWCAIHGVHPYPERRGYSWDES